MASFPIRSRPRRGSASENVKSVVEAAGLTMEHIVYTHVYMANPGDNYEAMNKVWGCQYFSHGIPAGARHSRLVQDADRHADRDHRRRGEGSLA